MSPKEVLYIEDALGHEQFAIAQCQEAVSTLQDPALKQQAQQMVERHNQLFKQFYQLV